jgi:hypothetical protein
VAVDIGLASIADELIDDGVVAVVSVGHRGGVGIKPFDIIAGDPNDIGGESDASIPDEKGEHSPAQEYIDRV